MGTYHTFFAADDGELERLFPGWKPVKKDQVLVERVSSFSKQKMTVEDWEPVERPTPLGRPSLYDDAWGAPMPPIVPVLNEYMRAVEESGAPGLRALPHFRAKNCDPLVTLDALVAALVGGAVPVPPARVGCDGDDDIPTVWALPEVATNALAKVDDEQLAAIMDKVLAADVMGSGDATDSEMRTYLVDNVLGPLRALAVEAIQRGARVCHYFALHH
jgi:hypothetical protein